MKGYGYILSPSLRLITTSRRTDSRSFLRTGAGRRISMKAPTYTPLSYSSREIRLVTVQPSSEKSAPIECSTTTVSLDQAPKYYALSYCWGDLGIADRISLNHAEVPVIVGSLTGTPTSHSLLVGGSGSVAEADLSR
jgi:hypothetical protein